MTAELRYGGRPRRELSEGDERRQRTAQATCRRRRNHSWLNDDPDVQLDCLRGCGVRRTIRLVDGLPKRTYVYPTNISTRLDYTVDNRTGSYVERRTVGYYPANSERRPAGTKDSWAILCTVPGAIGPITETRTVTYTEWEEEL